MLPPGETLLPLNPADASIAEKLEGLAKGRGWLHDAVLSRKLFSIESDFVEKNPSAVRPYNDGDSFDPATEIKLLTNDKSGSAGRARWYVASRSVITTGLEHLDRWKVIVLSANAGGQRRDNHIAVVDNHSAFGRSRVALRTFATEAEARNFYRYATSELIRFAFLLSDEALTSLAKKVPDMHDYSDKNGIIDYHGNVDEQLYKLANLTESEIRHVKVTLASLRR